MDSPKVEVKVFPRGFGNFVAEFKVIGVTSQVESPTPRGAFRLAKEIAREAIRQSAKIMREGYGAHDFDVKGYTDSVEFVRNDLASDPYPPDAAPQSVTVHQALARATERLPMPTHYTPPTDLTSGNAVQIDKDTFEMDGAVLDAMVPTPGTNSPPRIKLPLGWLDKDSRKALKDGTQPDPMDMARSLRMSMVTPS